MWITCYSQVINANPLAACALLYAASTLFSLQGSIVLASVHGLGIPNPISRPPPHIAHVASSQLSQLKIQRPRLLSHPRSDTSNTKRFYKHLALRVQRRRPALASILWQSAVSLRPSVRVRIAATARCHGQAFRLQLPGWSLRRTEG